MRIFLFALIVFFAPLSHAQTTSPCMIFKNGNWQLINKKIRGKKNLKGKEHVCVQYTKKDYKPVVDRLIQLDVLKKKTLPLLRKKAAAFDNLDRNWQLSQFNWNRQVQVYNKLIQYNQKEAQTWRNAFLVLQKQKAPKTSWTRSPVLWFSVGVITTVGVTIAISLAVNAGK